MAFFEQLGKHLTDAGQNVAQQTKNLADLTQLNSAISDKEKKIIQLFQTIGQTYYEAHKEDESAETLEMIAEVNALYAEIAQNREKIKQIKGVTKCDSCGAEVPANAAFCNVCGSKIAQTESVQESAEERRCPACNAVVKKDNLFCNQCGAKMENTNE